MSYDCRFHNPSHFFLRGHSLLEKRVWPMFLPSFFSPWSLSQVLFAQRRRMSSRLLQATSSGLFLDCLVQKVKDLMRLLGSHTRATNRAGCREDSVTGQIHVQSRGLSGTSDCGVPNNSEGFRVRNKPSHYHWNEYAPFDL